MSLANKLSLYISVVIIAIFCAIGTLAWRYNVEREECVASQYASMMVDNSVDKLNSEIQRIERLLTNSAPLVVRKLDDTSVLMPMIEHIVTRDSLIMGGCIALRPDTVGHIVRPRLMEYVSLDKNGRVIRKHLGDSDDYDYTGMSWFRDALKSKDAVWSDPYYDKGGGDTMMVTCSYPLRDSKGTVVGVITADMSLAELSQEIDRLRPMDDSYAFIVSDKGIFMAHPDSTLILKKDIYSYGRQVGCRHIAEVGRQMLARKSGATHTDMAGMDALVVYEPVPGTGWSICCVSPYKSVMSRLGFITAQSAVFLFIGLILIIVLVRLVVLYSMKPLGKLTAAADRISEGDLNVTLPEMKPSDDIGRLNNAFAEMQKSLRQQMEQLVVTTRAKEHIESELHIARGIQMSLLPHVFSPFPGWDNLELYARIRPAKEVGGDLYDFFIRDSKLFFAIGDVSGKGVPAALFMAVTRTSFRNIADKCDSPSRIMTLLNNTVIKDNDSCMFVTMFVGVLDIRSGHLSYCNAGHNPPVLMNQAEAVTIQSHENIPVGVIGDFEYEENSINLQPGQSLFLYTDGLTEAENGDKKLYGEDRMLSTLSACDGETPQTKIECVEKSVDEFAGGVDQSDDLTMLCIRLLDTESGPERRILTNSLTEVSTLPVFTEQVLERYGLDPEMAGHVNLMLEEALVNVIDYAYPEGVEGEIELTTEYNASEGMLTFRIADHGKPFDPTQASAPDLDASAEDRPIGGLGIYLVRTLADRVEYSREGDRNILRISIRTDKPAI